MFKEVLRYSEVREPVVTKVALFKRCGSILYTSKGWQCHLASRGAGPPPPPISLMSHKLCPPWSWSWVSHKLRKYPLRYLSFGKRAESWSVLMCAGTIWVYTLLSGYGEQAAGFLDFRYAHWEEHFLAWMRLWCPRIYDFLLFLSTGYYYYRSGYAYLWRLKVYVFNLITLYLVCEWEQFAYMALILLFQWRSFTLVLVPCNEPLLLYLRNGKQNGSMHSFNGTETKTWTVQRYGWLFWENQAGSPGIDP